MGEVKKLTFVADDGSGTYERLRKGSRGILIKDGKLLLVHELATGYYSIPGGGHEEGETLEETCIREMAEEAGILVEVEKELSIVEAKWKDSIYENHFFLCTYKGETDTNQTQQEAEAELRGIWVTLEEAKAIFSDPNVYQKGMAWFSVYQRDLWVLENL